MSTSGGVSGRLQSMPEGLSGRIRGPEAGLAKILRYLLRLILITNLRHWHCRLFLPSTLEVSSCKIRSIHGRGGRGAGLPYRVDRRGHPRHRVRHGAGTPRRRGAARGAGEVRPGCRPRSLTPLHVQFFSHTLLMCISRPAWLEDAGSYTRTSILTALPKPGQRIALAFHLKFSAKDRIMPALNIDHAPVARRRQLPENHGPV